MKCLCLQAMALVYGLHHSDIGAFNDTRYIVTMLSRTCDKLERDRLLLFLNKVKNLYTGQVLHIHTSPLMSAL